MMNLFNFISLQADTLATTLPKVANATSKADTEINVLVFLLKGGFFLIPIALLLLYTIYVIVERWMYIHKESKMDAHLMQDIRVHLQQGNLDMAYTVADRNTVAQGRVLKSGIQTIGQPLREVESAMERSASIEIGEMEHRLGHLGLIAGIAPTLGFIGTISGVIKIFYSISITEDISIGNISGGLYEKMISSGAGLVVGIVAYSAYHLFNGKIDGFLLNTQKQVLEFLTILQRPGHGNQKK